ncbi:hypothetical protein ACFFJB_14580 [Camelimonas abortus]|uniref:Uncharacterized protein n=1 Tax=Camelimonas abortus TaxID=1017184 RepID=A0ABV7LGQ1_9HYPH
MTSNVMERGLYKTGDGWVQVVAGEELRRVRAQAYLASGAQPPLEHLPLRRQDGEDAEASRQNAARPN